MKYYVIAGGTFEDVAPHLALAAPAFGTVGRRLAEALPGALAACGRREAEVELVLTRMALGGHERSGAERALLGRAGLRDLYGNGDVARLLEQLVADPATRAIIMPAAICDFEPAALQPAAGGGEAFGRRHHPRLSSRQAYQLGLAPAAKVAARVRAERKDVFLTLFKTSAGDDAAAQHARGLSLLKRHSANLVLANDLRTRRNMVITPEEARYHDTLDRAAAVQGLAEMIALRSGLRFTRSTVVPGAPVPWRSPEIPATLRAVVDHCVRRGAYKPFLGATVGHFAARGEAGTIVTSRRKTDFNRLDELGLVRVEPRGDDAVVAYGAKPSVGGQSQRIVFRDHPDADCIVHFHCPLRPGSQVPIRSQRPYECGSHECGENTSSGLRALGVVKAVMLDRHGPNITFSRAADPALVIEFIERNFDLAARSGGDIDLAAA
jgi:hypothetical protein